MSDTPSKPHILVVEDELFLRELYVQILKEAGFEVDEADDGAVAFEKMHEGGYDLVLLDIVLPKKDGLQILKELKTNPSKKPNKRILILSNLGEEPVISEGVSMGIPRHLIKFSSCSPSFDVKSK